MDPVRNRGREIQKFWEVDFINSNQIDFVVVHRMSASYF